MNNKYITPDILQVKALDDYLLYIVFDTKEEKIYDMKDLIDKIEFYKKLKDKAYFKQVKAMGETVQWNNGEDVCPENLYNDSIAVNEYNGKIQELN